jgi:type IV secretory pathway VirB10-like protein
MGGRLLAAAAVAVIALLGGLWFLMNDSDAPAANAPEKREPVAVAPAPEKPPAAVPATKREPVAPPVVLRRPTQPTAPSAGGSTTAPTLTDDAAVKPPTTTESLKEQVMLTESHVLECGDKAAKAGKKLDGEAAFGFTIARKDGKIVVESTGTEYSGFDKATSDCFRETANAMVFDALPDGVDALTGYRKVEYKDGVLKRQWMTEFAVTRPPPAP